jgi:hypothetical protein
MGDWVGSRAGLDDKKSKFLTLSGLELRPVGRSAPSQSLYRLRYFLLHSINLNFQNACFKGKSSSQKQNTTIVTVKDLQDYKSM